MKKLILNIALLFLTANLFSQRTNFGGYMCFTSLKIPSTIKIDRDYIFPEHSYKAFSINEKKQKTTGSNVNITAGFFVSKEYRLFSVSTALVYSMREFKFEIEPVGGLNKYSPNIILQCVEIPLDLNYVIINGCRTRLRINAGISNCIGWGSEMGGDNVFEGIVYKSPINYYLKAFTGVSIAFKLLYYQSYIGPRFEIFSPAPGVVVKDFLISWVFYYPLDNDGTVNKIYMHEE